MNSAGNFLQGKHHKVLFNIHFISHVVDISEFSSFQQEKELLLLPGRELRVRNCTLISDGLTIIELQEVEGKYPQLHGIDLPKPDFKNSHNTNSLSKQDIQLRVGNMEKTLRSKKIRNESISLDDFLEIIDKDDTGWAQFQAGSVCLLQKNEVEAMKYFSLALPLLHSTLQESPHNPKILYALGVIYLDRIEAPDLPNALEYLERSGSSAWNDGEYFVDAWFKLGEIFHYGGYPGIEQDKKKAKKYYKKTKPSHVQANINLAEIYYDDREYAKESNSLKEAANQGSPVAKNLLGMIYKEGTRGRKPKLEKAKKFFREAAELGLDSAQLNLALILDSEGSSEALQYYEAAANSANLDALYRLGKKYKTGYGVDADMKKAVQYFERAANCIPGHALSQYTLASIYEHGLQGIVPKDLEAAMKYYERSAKNGNPDGFYGLSRIHRRKKNKQQATEYLKKATENGSKRAKKFLAAAEEKSIGNFMNLSQEKEVLDTGDAEFDAAEALRSKKDFERAIMEYTAAAKRGHVQAQLTLARLRKSDTIPDTVLEKQVQLYWCEIAATKGNVRALEHLGRIYREGLKVEQDLARAEDYLQKAFEAGSKTALFSLAELCKQQGQYEKSFIFLQQAAEENVLAQYQLGKFYLYGRGTPRDVSRSLLELKKAADRGSVQANFKLGKLYLSGDDVRQDTELGVVYLTEAGRLGHGKAQFKLARLYHFGFGKNPPNLRRAIRYYKKSRKLIPDSVKELSDLQKIYEQKGYAAYDDNENSRAEDDFALAAIAGSFEAKKMQILLKFQASSVNFKEATRDLEYLIEKKCSDAEIIFNRIPPITGRVLSQPWGVAMCIAYANLMGQDQKNSLVEIAANIYRPKARAGDAQAMTELGKVYFETGNMQKAWDCFFLAAQRNNSDAKVFLAVLHLRKLLREDENHAEHLATLQKHLGKPLHIVAEEAEAEAEYLLGIMYQEGTLPLRKNKEQAKRLLRSACKKGNAEAGAMLLLQKLK